MSPHGSSAGRAHDDRTRDLAPIAGPGRSSGGPAPPTFHRLAPCHRRPGRETMGCVGAIRARTGALVRRRFPATVVLTLLIGVAGAVVLTAVAGARRGDRALPAFLARQRPPSAVVYDVRAAESAGGTASSVEPESAALERLPYVETAMRGAPLVVAGPDDGRAVGRRRQLALVSLDRGGSDFLGRPILVEGRRADEASADEAVVDEEFFERTGVGVGEIYPITAFTAEQVGVALDVKTPPAGPEVGLRVVGVVRQPHDLLPTRPDQEATYLDHADLYLTPGFWERYGPDLASFGIGIGVRLDGGQGDVGRLRRDARRLFGEAAFVDDIDPERGVASIPVDGVRRAIDLEGRALQGFAALTALAGLVIVGQALSRQSALEALDAPVLRSLGMSRSQLVAAGTLRAAVVAGCGAAIALVGAVALSPLTPIGVARRAELHPGVHVNTVVLALGAAAMVISMCAWAAVASWRSSATGRGTAERSRPVRGSEVARHLPVAGATGLALARRGSPGGGAPVRSAFVAAIATVVAITGAAGFRHSLDGLNRAPAAFGVTWDASVGNVGDPDQAAAAEARLRRNPDVAAYAGVNTEDLLVGPRQGAVSALVLFEGRGAVPPRVVEGRVPRAAGEIAFGGRTLDELGLSAGEDALVQVQDFEPASFRVTGRLVPNSAALDEEIDNGEGAVMTADAHGRLVPPAIAELTVPEAFLVRLDPAVDRRVGLSRLEREFPLTVIGALPPSDVDNVSQVSAL